MPKEKKDEPIIGSSLPDLDPWASLGRKYNLPQIHARAQKAEAEELTNAYRRYWLDLAPIYVTKQAQRVYNALGVMVADPVSIFTDSIKSTAAFLYGWLEGYRVKHEENTHKSEEAAGEPTEVGFIGAVRHASYAHTAEHIAITTMYEESTGTPQRVLCIVDKETHVTPLARIDLDVSKLVARPPQPQRVNLLEKDDENQD